MRVKEPPIIDAYANGIKVFDGLMPKLRERDNAIGSVIAKAAISFMKPEINPTKNSKIINGRMGLFSNLIKYSWNLSKIPEFSRDFAIIREAAIVIIA